MFKIVYNQDVSNLSHGTMDIHRPAQDELVFVSPELTAMGCPNITAAAITWVAMNHTLRLVERRPTKTISRSMREMTLTLEEIQ